MTESAMVQVEYLNADRSLYFDKEQSRFQARTWMVTRCAFNRGFSMVLHREGADILREVSF